MPTVKIVQPPPELKAAIAFHEAGHAVATVLAFRLARTPKAPPHQPVKFISIFPDGPGQWGGSCFGPQIYTTQWPDSRISARWRDAMEWQLVTLLAGGVAEAIHRGERNKRDMFWFAMLNCETDDDLESAEAILVDLQLLTGRRPDLRRFSERACVLLREHWPTVKTIANVLIEDGCLDGDRLNEIVSNMHISLASAA